MTTTTKVILVGLTTAALLLVGRWSAGWGAEDATTSQGEHDHSAMDEAADAKASLWTCPMHPQIKLPDPGDCPICGMDLVPMAQGGDDNPMQLVMSPAAKELAQVEVQVVRRKNVTRPVRMVGKVDYDETAVRTISAWVPGRLDRLYVDYTGVQVNEGDHLVWLYSPDLLTAQEELLSARNRLTATQGEASEFLAKSNQRAYETARDKLLLWGLTEEQVVEIEERGTAEDHVMLTSPNSGVVIDKLVNEGAYVETGTRIYRIADLNHLWVRLDAYEQDLAWLRYGQDVAFEVEALPGETFHGQVSYIDPMVHENTRTAKVRVNVNNADGRLKPGMFVRAYAQSRLGAGGVVLDRALAGKWVSPMHPEVVKDGPGQCDVCGMDLVPAETLGLVSSSAPTTERPIVVPQSAVLVTGKRAVVYIEVPGSERPTYEGREVTLGPRAGDEYLVLAGLEEGERVVVNGAFRIDSAMQIMAKRSMMSAQGEQATLGGPAASVFRKSLRPLYDSYFAATEALAADDAGAARDALGAMAEALKGPSAAGLPAQFRTLWREESVALASVLQGVADQEDIELLRRTFDVVSKSMLAIALEFGHGGDEPIREAFCPMAFDDRGAAWLQRSEQIANPYFGASMLRCGEIRSTLPGAQPTSAGAAHEGHDHAAMPESSPVQKTGTPQREAGQGSPLAQVFEHYLSAGEHLADDAPVAARQSVDALLPAVVAAVEAKDTPVEAQKHLHEMHSALVGAGAARDVEALRTLFRDLSDELLKVEQVVGNPTGEPLHVVHCPMAFDDTGADWIQRGDTVANPYYGASMLRCGAVTRVSERR